MSDPIPFLDLPTQHAPLAAEMTEMFAQAVATGGFIGGPNVQKFQEEFASFCEAKHCLGVANGTDAIMLALRALGVGPGDKVVVPAQTFIATAEAVNMVGATPVLVDVSPDSHTLDPAALAQLDPTDIKAVIPVHLYGQAADMPAIMKVANQHGWYVIEDCAQAHGATVEGRKIGTFGQFGCFSFYPGKNLGALGDGGALISDDEELLENARLHANHGRTSRTDHMVAGVNSRLDAIQAGALRIKLPHLKGWNDSRIQVADWYFEAFKEVSGLVLPTVVTGRRHVFHLFVIQVLERDALMKTLKSEGIGCGLHYPTPIHLHPAYEGLGHTAGAFPHSERVASHGLSLPMFPGMTEAQVQRVADVVTTHLKEVT